MAGEDAKYEPSDVIHVGHDDEPHVYQYIQLAHDAQAHGLGGVVIGAPSEKNHIEKEEIMKAREYVGDEMLVLLPGVGAQGGEAGSIWQYFGTDKVIVNVGRGLMFPDGSRSTSKGGPTGRSLYGGRAPSTA